MLQLTSILTHSCLISATRSTRLSTCLLFLHKFTLGPTLWRFTELQGGILEQAQGNSLHFKRFRTSGASLGQITSERLFNRGIYERKLKGRNFSLVFRSTSLSKLSLSFSKDSLGLYTECVFTKIVVREI